MLIFRKCGWRCGVRIGKNGIVLCELYLLIKMCFNRCDGVVEVSGLGMFLVIDR